MSTYYKIKANIVDSIFILLGCIISSLGVNLFLSHAKLLSSGITGIALTIEYTLGIPSGIGIIVLNIPLLILSYKKLDKSFTIFTTIGMLCLSFSLILTKPLSNLIQLNDALLYCIYGGILYGTGLGLIFLRNGSTAGIDIIIMLIRKKYSNSNFNIGSLGFIINLLIVAVGAIIFGIPQALYTLISLFIQSIVIDKILKGFCSKKLILILTEKEEDIINYVIKELKRGITSLYAEGEYTHQSKRMLYCIVNSRQMIQMKQEICKIDPACFITIVDTSEVRGKGFKDI